MHVESWRSRELRMLILHSPFVSLPLDTLPITVDGLSDEENRKYM